MAVGKVTAALVALGLVSGCGKVSTPDQLVVDCPDPAERAILVEGATYRDLAVNRAEALSGWRQCHDALTIVQM